MTLRGGPRSASQNITGHFHDGAAEHLQESKFVSSSTHSPTSSAFHLPGETSAKPTGNEERNMASPSVATALSCRGFREKPDVVPGGVKTRAYSVQRACLSMRIPVSSRVSTDQLFGYPTTSAPCLLEVYHWGKKLAKLIIFEFLLTLAFSHSSVKLSFSHDGTLQHTSENPERSPFSTASALEAPLGDWATCSVTVTNARAGKDRDKTYLR